MTWRNICKILGFKIALLLNGMYTIISFIKMLNIHFKKCWDINQNVVLSKYETDYREAFF